VLLSGSALVLSTWQAGLPRSSWGAHRSVALIGGTALVAVIALGRGRQRQTTRTWASGAMAGLWRWRRQPKATVVSVLVWCTLVIGVIGWDLSSFVLQSPSFPTLSTLVGHITRHPLGRGLLFAGWLVVGAYLVAGWRAETPP
jgi:hypothetical protein